MATNNQIAKNTLMLYIRMIIITFVSLYTVRATLNILGTEDYGLYNVVCGVVGFLSFITTTLNTSAQRFLSFEIGKGISGRYSQIFTILCTIFALLSIIIAIVAELLGPWLIRNHLVIPSYRLNVAIQIFHISIVSVVIRFLAIPFSASVISYEKMNIFAYVSIAEALLKLVVLYLLVQTTYDKLFAYAILILLSDFTISLVYILYCFSSFQDCRIIKVYNWSRIKDLGKFIGWNTFGTLSSVFVTQGMTIVLNMFFAPVIIAAKAVADRIQSFAYSFVSNFIIASSPQMVKLYASNDKGEFVKLFFRTSKFSFILMALISFPLIVVMPQLLQIWLGEDMMNEMTSFSRLTLLGCLVSALETPISRAMHATGIIKKYQIINCSFALITIPVAYAFFKFGLGAEWNYIIAILFMSISLFYRLNVLQNIVPFKRKEYFMYVIIPMLLLTTNLSVVYYFLNQQGYEMNMQNTILTGIISAIIGIIMTYFLALNKIEKKYLINIIKNRLKI